MVLVLRHPIIRMETENQDGKENKRMGIEWSLKQELGWNRNQNRMESQKQGKQNRKAKTSETEREAECGKKQNGNMERETMEYNKPGLSPSSSSHC